MIRTAKEVLEDKLIFNCSPNEYLKTGFGDIFVNFVHGSIVYIIGGTRVTNFSLLVTDNLIGRQSRRGIYFTTNCSSYLLIEKLCFSKNRILHSDYYEPSPKQWKEIVDCRDFIKSSNLYFSDTDIQLNEIIAEAENLIKKEKTHFLFIDKFPEIYDCKINKLLYLKAIQQFARDNGLVVFLLFEYSWWGEPNKPKPTLETIRKEGPIDKYADYILSIQPDKEDDFRFDDMEVFYKESKIVNINILSYTFSYT